MEATKKRKLSQEDCETVRYLLKYGRTLKEIAEIIHVDPSTVGKIRLANYDLPTYLEQRKAMNRKTKENKRAAWRNKMIMEQLSREAEQDIKILDKMLKEPEVPGQMKMDLQAERNVGDGSVVPPECNEQNRPLVPEETKNLMKFQAAMMDKLLKKLDELIDVLKGGGKDE